MLLTTCLFIIILILLKRWITEISLLMFRLKSLGFVFSGLKFINYWLRKPKVVSSKLISHRNNTCHSWYYLLWETCYMPSLSCGEKKIMYIPKNNYVKSVVARETWIWVDVHKFFCLTKFQKVVFALHNNILDKNMHPMQNNKIYKMFMLRILFL